MVMTWEWGGKEGEPSRTPRAACVIGCLLYHR